jgi:DNA replicative helicase MCM subunit Mcm2 (Cdc46/Mcm family)
MVAQTQYFNIFSLAPIGDTLVNNSQTSASRFNEWLQKIDLFCKEIHKEDMITPKHVRQIEVALQALINRAPQFAEDLAAQQLNLIPKAKETLAQWQRAVATLNLTPVDKPADAGNGLSELTPP